MNLIRLLLILLIVALLYPLVVRLLRRPSKEGRSPRQLPTGTMVRCLHCGLHLPTEEAIRGHKGVYCSEHHRQLKELPGDSDDDQKG